MKWIQESFQTFNLKDCNISVWIIYFVHICKKNLFPTTPPSVTVLSCVHRTHTNKLHNFIDGENNGSPLFFHLLPHIPSSPPFLFSKTRGLNATAIANPPTPFILPVEMATKRSNHVPSLRSQHFHRLRMGHRRRVSRHLQPHCSKRHPVGCHRRRCWNFSYDSHC